ncbi:MAG: ABC transporter substrate-binding protein [Thiobacillaceae bacterium]|jgi:iron(III) transport system substrate-binding protein|nr:ABC transporter substrate-binding protein [Thiobacillaceae bacterium]
MFAVVAHGHVNAAEPAGPTPIRVLSDRTESHLKPLFEAFTKQTGIPVEAVYMDKGLIDRVAGNPTEADVLITKDAELMEIAREKGFLRPHDSSLIRQEIDKRFQGPGGSYFVDAYRARLIFYARDRVKPEQLSTYADLAAPRWKGRICIRSGYHDYNVALFSQMNVAYGPEKTRALIRGLHDNLAREPKGNDREQAKMIHAGKCDLALMNVYYHPIMMDNPEQRPWAEGIGVFYPDQRQGGAFIMRSAVGMTQAKRNRDAARLVEFMASREGQFIMTNLTYQFPTNTHVAPSAKIATLGADQPGVKDGRFRINFVDLTPAAQQREAVVKVLNEVRFDKP